MSVFRHVKSTMPLLIAFGRGGWVSLANWERMFLGRMSLLDLNYFREVNLYSVDCMSAALFMVFTQCTRHPATQCVTCYAVLIPYTMRHLLRSASPFADFQCAIVTQVR